MSGGFFPFPGASSFNVAGSSSGPQATAATGTGGFSFSSAPSQSFAAPSGGFSFGSSSSAPATGAPAAAMGAPMGAPTATTGASTTFAGADNAFTGAPTAFTGAPTAFTGAPTAFTGAPAAATGAPAGGPTGDSFFGFSNPGANPTPGTIPATGGFGGSGSNSAGPSLFGASGGTPAAGGAAPFTFAAPDSGNSASAQAPGVSFASQPSGAAFAFGSQPPGNVSSAAASSSNPSTSTGPVGSVSFGGFSQPNASTSSSTSAPGSGAGPSSSGAVMFGGTATGTPPSAALFGGSGAGTSSTGAPSSGPGISLQSPFAQPSGSQPPSGQEEKKDPSAQESRIGTLTVDEIIHMWNQDIAEQSEAFLQQAIQVKKWDERVISNGNKVIELQQKVANVKVAQRKLDMALGKIKTNQQDFLKNIGEIEKEVGQKSANTGMMMDRDQQHREETYKLAENIDKELITMLRKLNDTVKKLNTTSEKNLDPANPMSAIVRILNKHMGSLLWIDETASGMEAKVGEIKKMLAKMQDGQR